MVELTFLGTGNAFAAGGRNWSSFLANGRYLFDASPSVLPALNHLNIPPIDIEVIFLSHFHGDHFAGMPFLILEYVYMSERRGDLYVVGPPGVEQKIERLADDCYPDITREAGYGRRYTEAQPGADQFINEISFRAYPMNHVPDKLRAFGYRVSLGDQAVAYTGDTMFCDEIFELAEGARVLVLDCTYSEGGGPEHMGLDDLRVIRDRVAPETAIVLTHLNGEPDVSGFENVIAARDFASYRFD
ncbi:MAG: MBL fold metallo-hydrolase [Dehalococcoidia bacterium]